VFFADAGAAEAAEQESQEREARVSPGPELGRPSSRGALSVLTLNLWHDSPPYAARAARIGEWLRRLQPDLIGFQEALRGAAWCQVSRLLSGLGYHVAFGGIVQFWKRDGVWYGNAVASRWPLVREQHWPLPRGESRERRAALSVQVDAPCGRLSFTTTHLHHRSPDVRALQMAALRERLEPEMRAGGFPPILVGDLNAAPESSEIRQLVAPRRNATPAFIDAWERAGRGAGLTWSAGNGFAKVRQPPGRRLDYILVGHSERSGIGEPLKCEVVCHDQREGVWPSDHFGVYAELRSTARDSDGAGSFGAPSAGWLAASHSSRNAHSISSASASPSPASGHAPLSPQQTRSP
jgi:endonuclease/exonuclease/phosphatase family metal-dependent hydrolase